MQRERANLEIHVPQMDSARGTLKREISPLVPSLAHLVSVAEKDRRVRARRDSALQVIPAGTEHAPTRTPVYAVPLPLARMAWHVTLEFAGARGLLVLLHPVSRPLRTALTTVS